MRPERFETEPNAPNAEKLYKHWKLTFTNYLETTIPEGEDNSNNQNAINRKKLFALINNVSADVFDIVSDTDNFDTAIQALDNAYIKPTNTIYNRHQLITCKQDPTQTIDNYMQELERISKTCKFEAVTAEQNKQQYTRDAFINGIHSSYIRQRLLESSILSLEQAYQQARSLEQAQKQSAAYDNSIAAGIEHDDIKNQSTLAATNSKDKDNRKIKETKEQCYFCGNARHQRINCPAREAECRKCKKKGHWAKVCRSQISAGITNPDLTFPTLA